VVELEAGAPAEAGFAEAVVDPVINALHIGMQGHDRSLTAAITEYRQLLSERALDNGPDALDADEQRRLLADPQRMRWLHNEVWAQAPSAWRAWLAERPAAASTQDSPRAV
jgi:membrane glycosyltransferase